MKKIVFLFLIGLISFSAKAQQKTPAENAPVFKFKKEVIDYGEIEKGSDGTRVFTFKNIGKSPLIINDVRTTCGCTVPSKPKEPIMPGATGEITVKYDTNKAAPFNKAITIFSNASEAKKVVYIKGRVKKVSALTILERKEKSMMASDKKNN